MSGKSAQSIETHVAQFDQVLTGWSTINSWHCATGTIVRIMLTTLSSAGNIVVALLGRPEKRMQEMMNSDMMEEVLGNPEKMEQARQAILDNPTLKQAMSQLPGFADMVSDPRTAKRTDDFNARLWGRYQSCREVGGRTMPTFRSLSAESY